MVVVEFKNYSFSYLGEKYKALANINLSIEEGTSVGILGPAGSGKSTLIKALSGLVPVEIPGVEEGDIIVNGKNSRELEPLAFSQEVGVVLDKPGTQLLGLTVFDDCAFGPTNLGLDESEVLKRVEFALSVTRLNGLERRNPEELSGGQQQSLAIADILAMRPRVLALDEPVSMLDSEGKERVMSIVKTLVEEQGSTLVVSESGLDLESIAQYLDRLVVLDKGRVVLDGTPREVLTSPVVEEVGVGRPEITELFIKIDRVSKVEEIPYTLEEAESAVRRILVGGRRKFDATASNRSTSQGEHAIIVENLQHVYPPDVKALDGVSIEILEGEIVGLIGQNGSGKTTLCLHLVGVLKPSNVNAKVQVFNIDATKVRMNELIKRINYVFQNPDNMLFQESVERELSYGLGMTGVTEDEAASRIKEALVEFDLERHLDTPISELPRDVRTILAIACVYVLRPKILILDEPTSAMDKQRTQWFIDLVRRLNARGATILVVSHNMELVAKLCNRLIVMTDGKVILDGPTRDVFSQPDVLVRAKIRPPQITQLAQTLGEFGFPKDVLSSEEFFNLLYPNGKVAA